jgi:hypothetical protein
MVSEIGAQEQLTLILSARDLPTAFGGILLAECSE